jgi:hypothetical protein
MPAAAARIRRRGWPSLLAKDGIADRIAEL